MRARSVRRIGAVLLSLAGAVGCGSGTSGATKTSAEVILNERMASVLLHEGRFQDAETAYRDVIRSDPKNPEVHDGLGVCLMMQALLVYSLLSTGLILNIILSTLHRHVLLLFVYILHISKKRDWILCNATINSI